MGGHPSRGLFQSHRLCFTGVLLLLCICFTTAATPDNDKLNVFVSILPQAYIVERVGGTQVRVEVLVGPGQSPETFDPTPGQMTALAAADVFFAIGVPFEARLISGIHAVNPNIHVVNPQEDIEPHCDKPDNPTDRTDPHTWLNPRLVKRQAAVVCRELCRLDSADAQQFRNNLAELQADLDSLDALIREELTPLKGRRFYVYHAAYGYFAEAYELIQVPIETDGKEPTARQLAELLERARHDNVKVIFIQPQFSTKSAQAVAEAIGAKLVPLDPLPRNYLDGLHRIADQIKTALTGEPGR